METKPPHTKIYAFSLNGIITLSFDINGSDIACEMSKQVVRDLGQVLKMMKLIKKASDMNIELSEDLLKLKEYADSAPEIVKKLIDMS
ncbi:MAG: hypothetical protein JW871_02500 [Endomicrobiales bacterium]|nr:hypothetical protein [Endomicrobiales bacterium]